MAKKNKRGRPRKKTDREIYEEIKAKRKSKRKIQPGQWSKIGTDLKVVAKLKKTDSCVPSWPPFLGKYITHDDGYALDGYRAKVKITIENLPLNIKEYGVDQVLAACEESLNSYKYRSGRKVLGDLVIMELLYDEKSRREDYLPCLIKTNRRHIPQFMGVKKGILQVF